MRDTDAPIHGTVCKNGQKPSGDDDSLEDVSQGRFVPCNSANVFSVKIVDSNVGFPIQVYGTVIARDSLDLKCVYLFNRRRDDCQLVLSKDESLILTGPKRGLALIDGIYFEVNLKVKCGGRKHKDKQLSKGFLGLDGVPYISQDEIEVQRYALDTMLSQVVLTCAVDKNAVEATIAIEVIQGKFYGEINACTTGIRDSIVLHDSKIMTADSTDNGTKGAIPLLRHVVSVGLKEKLILTVARTGACKAKSAIKFTPRVNGGDEKEITCGFIKMRVKVIWSIILCLHID
ncbi:hypothetical protein EJB05_34437, partial [Eragrostis curvula]